MKAQDAHFDAIAAEYDDSIPVHVMAHLTARRVELARSLVPTGKVLDVGCGTGRFLENLPTTYQRMGVDVSVGMLEIAREKGLEVQQASGDDLPFDTDSFDLVASFALFHHIIEPNLVRATLREMVRVVRPGGAIIVWDHNPRNPYWRILMAKSPQDQGDERLVPAKLITETLMAEDLSNVILRHMTFTPDFTPRWALGAVSHIERALEKVPLV